jgi:cell division septation protein DedD
MTNEKKLRFLFLNFAGLIFCFVPGVFLIGCSSSEPPQKSATEQQPVPQLRTSEQPVTAKPKPLKSPQGFIAREDTIEAQLVKKSKQQGQPHNQFKAIEKKKYYSVQVGAFRIMANAERCQRLVKKRFHKPVYQFYDRPIKMYRVAVGNFSMKKTAFIFLHQVKKDFPKDYSDAWVAELRR